MTSARDPEPVEMERVAQATRAVLMPLDQALDVLLGLLGNESWRVRRAAAEACCRLRPPAAVADRLVQELRAHDDPSRRNAGLAALCGLGGEAVASLVRLLGDASPDLRKVAVDGLGALGDPVATPAVERLLQDPDPNVRAAAAETLGRLGGPAAEQALRRRLLPPLPEDPLETASVLAGLARLGAVVGPTLLLPWLSHPLTRCAALMVAAHSPADPDVVAALVSGLSSRSSSVRGAALRALHAGGPRAPVSAAVLAHPSHRELLSRAAHAHVDSSDEEAAASAAAVAAWVPHAGTAAQLLRARRGRPWDAAIAEALATGGEAAVVAVAQELQELSGEDQALALDLLAGHPFPATAPYLHALCAQARSDALAAAGAALLAVSPEMAAMVLAARLGEPEEDAEDAAVAETVLAEVAHVAPGRVREMVLPLLECPQPVLARAVRVLAAAAAPADHPVLVGLLQHPEAGVRAAACAAVSRLGHPEDVPRLLPRLNDEDAAVRVAAIHGLGSLGGPEALQALVGRTGDEDPRVMGAALEALIRRDAARAADLILRRVMHAAPRIKEAALAASEQWGGVTALAAGAACLLSPAVTVVRAALRALGASGRPEAAVLATAMLGDERWEVRHAAVQALGRLLAHGQGGVEARQALAAGLRAETSGLVREAMQRALEGLPRERA